LSNQWLQNNVPESIQYYIYLINFIAEVSKKLKVQSYATMRSSVGINDFMTDLVGFEQSLSKLSSKTSSAIILLISEKAKLVLPFMASLWINF